jgi:3-hydroxyacyl-CoA dehydrogenase
MAAAEGDIRCEITAEGVHVLTLDNPPANALTPGVRGALLLALQRAREAGASGVVLAGARRNFSAATMVDVAPGRPSLAEVCAAVEAMPCPVVAALQGAVVGPGAELALAAHVRVMLDGARMVWPEVGLGLVPEGGTTQRLPRLVGVAEALDILLRARAVTATEAVANGLADRVVEADLMPAALQEVRRLGGPRPVSARFVPMTDFVASQAAVSAARGEAARGILPAPLRIIDCVEAAMVLPFENGVALEAVAREDLEDSAESQGLRAAALAERRAAHLPPAVARVRPKAVAVLGLSGAAPQMAPLALLALTQGMQVRWADADAGRRAASVRWVAERQEAEVQAGRLGAVQRDADRARLSEGAGPEVLAGVDLLVQAPDAPVAPAAGLPRLVIGGAEGRLGLALAPSARMCELAFPEGAAPEDIAVAVAFLRRIGVPPLLVGKMPILGRRVAAAGRAALARLLALGVPRRVLGAALDGYGQPLPDLPDPETPAPMREMAEDEVLGRWLGAMANTGLALLDARVALRPSDVDLALFAGQGFPRWHCGPMHHAATRGLLVLRIPCWTG